MQALQDVPGMIGQYCVLQICDAISKYKFERRAMTSATLSFRVPSKFAEQTRTLAAALRMTSSDYVREAVREKNERTLEDRMIFLSGKLTAHHLAANKAMGAADGDGLG